MSRGCRILCGVPESNCTGSKYSTDQKHMSAKAHSSSEEAFHCMRGYLLSKGYKHIGGHEFLPPDGGPIEILTKKSRFGGRLRWGKLQQRFMPRHLSGRGIIV